MIGTRNPSKLEAWLDKNPDGKVAGLAEAVANADIGVLATKGNVARQVLKLAGDQNTAGKVIIDMTNPIADAAPQDGVLKYFSSLDDSLMEQSQQAFPKGDS